MGSFLLILQDMGKHENRGWHFVDFALPALVFFGILAGILHLSFAVVAISALPLCVAIGFHKGIDRVLSRMADRFRDHPRRKKSIP